MSIEKQYVNLTLLSENTKKVVHLTYGPSASLMKRLCLSFIEILTSDADLTTIQ